MRPMSTTRKPVELRMHGQKRVAMGQMPDGEAWEWGAERRARLDVRWKGRNSTTRIHKLPTQTWPLCRRLPFHEQCLFQERSGFRSSI